MNHLIEQKEFNSAIQLSKDIDILDSNLLIQQSKQWIDNSSLDKFGKFFSCQNETDILAEFFFLIANFFAADENFEAVSYTHLTLPTILLV